jgi:hypothetical protein
MNSINVKSAATADLLAFLNAHSGKAPVKRFSTRAAGERRVAALLEELGSKATKPATKKTAAATSKKGGYVQAYVDGSPVCPSCGGHVDVTAGEVIETKRGQRVVNEHIAFHHACGHEWDMNTGKPRRRAADKGAATRAAAIAASWQNPEVAAARATRHGVKVTGPNGGQATYKSVREAFVELGLPLGRHIKFRGALKAAGKQEIAGFKFKLA